MTIDEEHSGFRSWGWKAGIALLFLISGLFIFVVFSHMRPVLPERLDPIFRILLIVGFLAAASFAKRSSRFDRYWQLLFACFIAALATAIDLYLPSREWLLNLFHISLRTPAGIAVDKLDSSIIIVVSILVLNKISGNNLASLYLQKGNLKKGLTIGVIAFMIAAAGAIPVSGLFFGGRNLQVERVLSWTPWILIFIAGNAFNEELLFRGLFLRKFEPFIGRFFSNLVIAIPFALHHSGVSYTTDTLLFLALLIPLALVWGYLTQKNNSLWGSVLFHAGTDIPIVLGIFSSL